MFLFFKTLRIRGMVLVVCQGIMPRMVAFGNLYFSPVLFRVCAKQDDLILVRLLGNPIPGGQKTKHLISDLFGELMINNFGRRQMHILLQLHIPPVFPALGLSPHKIIFIFKLFSTCCKTLWRMP
jgi:hypothetical protein